MLSEPLVVFNLLDYFKNEYNFEYKLALKKPFTEPKIYTSNGDLSKYKYLYFSFRNPKTNMRKKMNSVYGIANSGWKLLLKYDYIWICVRDCSEKPTVTLLGITRTCNEKRGRFLCRQSRRINGNAQTLLQIRFGNIFQIFVLGF